MIIPEKIFLPENGRGNAEAVCPAQKRMIIPEKDTTALQTS